MQPVVSVTTRPTGHTRNSIPGLVWLPTDTVEWSGSVIRAMGGWLGSSEAVRTAARRAFRSDTTGAFDPDRYILVTCPNEDSTYLRDGGDERPMTLSDLRALCAELVRMSGMPGSDARVAERALMRLAHHAAAHKMRIGTH